MIVRERIELTLDERGAVLSPRDPYADWLTFKLRLLALGYTCHEWRDHDRLLLCATFFKSVNPHPHSSE